MLFWMFSFSCLGSHLWRKRTSSVLCDYAKLYSFQSLAKKYFHYEVLFINIYNICWFCLGYLQGGISNGYKKYIAEKELRWYIQWECSCSIPLSRVWSREYASCTSRPGISHSSAFKTFRNHSIVITIWLTSTCCFIIELFILLHIT